MSIFDYLPDDKIYEISESLDVKSLSSFIRSSHKVYNICQNVLEKKGQKKCDELITYFKDNSYFLNLTPIDRTNLKRDINDCWVNENYSIISMSFYIDINWKTRKIKT